MHTYANLLPRYLGYLVSVFSFLFLFLHYYGQISTRIDYLLLLLNCILSSRLLLYAKL